MTDDPLERIIRPVVEGQLRSFVTDHPEVLAAVRWYRPRGRTVDPTTTFVNSISKRITRDLISDANRARLRNALLPPKCDSE